MLITLIYGYQIYDINRDNIEIIVINMNIIRWISNEYSWSYDVFKMVLSRSINHGINSDILHLAIDIFMIDVYLE